MNVLRLILVTLPVLLLGAVVAFFGWISRVNRRARSLDAIARRYHGIANTRSFCPRVQFPYFGGPCTLGIQTNRFSRHGSSTFVQLPWPNRKLALEVASAELAGGLKRNGLAQFHSSDAEFDRGFPAHCNEREFASRSLDENFRWRFREFAKQAGRDSIGLRIDRGTLNIFRARALSDDHELDEFLRLALQVIDQLKAGEIRGIEFINPGKATIFDEVVCPVCSERVAVEMVVCVRCKTPHCRDCWEYNTHCATFACGEKRFFSASSPSRS